MKIKIIVFLVFLVFCGVAYAENLETTYVNDEVLAKISDLVESDKDVSRLHGAATFCLGMAISKGLLEANDTIILKATPEYKGAFNFIATNIPRFANIALRAWLKAVDIDRENPKYHLGLALVLRLRGGSDLDRAIIELQEVSQLQPNDSTPYYFLSLAYQKKNMTEEAWLNIQKGLEKTISIDPYYYYEACENVLRYLGYNRDFAQEYAGIATKSLFSHFVFNIGLAMHLLTKEAFEIPNPTEEQMKQQLAYYKAFIDLSNQLSTIKPQNFFAESMGQLYKAATYTKLVIYYRNKNDREALNKLEEELYNLESSGAQINKRALRVFSALDKVQSKNQLINFVRESFILGEEESGLKNLDIKE